MCMYLVILSSLLFRHGIPSLDPSWKNRAKSISETPLISSLTKRIGMTSNERETIYPLFAIGLDCLTCICSDDFDLDVVAGAVGGYKGV
ncbi:hypothetical protein F4776DRAFT_351326 [Hypoxylon sp. NC0597]|nr:hypothetical protein F4776DRAFT_351326 [Hypoxylon sp. NC0597]